MTNPERLWVYTWVDGSRRATEAMSALVLRERQTEYVRADVAAAEKKAAEIEATKNAIRYVEENETNRLLGSVSALRFHLGRVLRIYKDETSHGDGMREDHVDDYKAAKACLDGFAVDAETEAMRSVVDALASFTAQDFALYGAHGIMRLVNMAKAAKGVEATGAAK